MHPTREFLGSSADLRPLSDLPALLVANPHRDVRGWEVIASNGRRLGRIVDLLVDVDHLRSDFLIIAMDAGPATGGRAVVPVRALREESDRRLVAGSGMEPIELSYQSTVRLATWVALLAALVLMLAWAVGALGA